MLADSSSISFSDILLDIFFGVKLGIKLNGNLNCKMHKLDISFPGVGSPAVVGNTVGADVPSKDGVSI